jgi:hypothetical protein
LDLAAKAAALQRGYEAIEVLVLGLRQHAIDQRRQSGSFHLAQRAFEHVAQT